MDKRFEESLIKNKRPETQEVLDLLEALAHHAAHFLFVSGGLGKYNLEHLEKSKDILVQLEEKATDKILRAKAIELREKFNEVRLEDPISEDLLDQMRKLEREVELVSHQLRAQK
ncbi:MAG: hypothetical protein WC858_05995 [Parcubacteria group bacterium]